MMSGFYTVQNAHPANDASEPVFRLSFSSCRIRSMIELGESSLHIIYLTKPSGNAVYWFLIILYNNLDSDQFPSALFDLATPEYVNIYLTALLCDLYVKKVIK